VKLRVSIPKNLILFLIAIAIVIFGLVALIILRIWVFQQRLAKTK